MRILYVTEVYPDEKSGLGVWGGGEKQFYEISNRISRSGHKVSVLTSRFPGQAQSESLDGVEIKRIGRTRDAKTGVPLKSFAPLTYILQTAREILHHEPDLIHCNTYFPVYAGALAAKLRRTPLVVTVHDLYGFHGWVKSQGSTLWGLLGHVVSVGACRLPHSRIITVSPQSKLKLSRIGVRPTDITVIPNGVDLELFDRTVPERIPHQILYVGRLVGFKHVDWLVMAMPHVLKRVPDATLKVVGGGPELPHLQDLVRNLGLDRHVAFTGVTERYADVAKYFKESSVYMLPSTVEGEAIAVKEAFAAGIPVVAMNVAGSGVLSLVRDGVNGFLVTPEMPELIAQKVIELLEDDEKRTWMGQTGRRMVEKFDWEVIAKHTLATYEELV